MEVEGNGVGGCVVGGDPSLSGGLAMGYDAEETTCSVYLTIWVVVVVMCVGFKGEGVH